MMEFLTRHWRDFLEIGLLAVCIYQLLRGFRSTRGLQILFGLSMVMIVLALLAEWLKFQVIGWILGQTLQVMAIGLMLIFQPELRQAFARLGSNLGRKIPFFREDSRDSFVDHLVKSAVSLSKKRYGALFAIHHDKNHVESFAESGVELDAVFTPELAGSVFFPKSPLHDGGMLIVGERIFAAGCSFPVTDGNLSDRTLGLRHRAAVGISEAVRQLIVVVVSEETGAISLCFEGKLERNLTELLLKERLQELLSPKMRLKMIEKGEDYERTLDA